MVLPDGSPQTLLFVESWRGDRAGCAKLEASSLSGCGCCSLLAAAGMLCVVWVIV
jgi:hypothetical protein